nr:MAG TPA_asm: hypothetical protein [Caudoviricetes sp.]
MFFPLFLPIFEYQFESKSHFVPSQMSYLGRFGV